MMCNLNTFSCVRRIHSQAVCVNTKQTIRKAISCTGTYTTLLWMLCSYRSFFMIRERAHLKIGPHNKDVIDTIVGSLLGDGWGEKRVGSTRFHLHMSVKNVEYLDYLHKFFIKNGYCSANKPRKAKQIAKSGQIYYSIKIRTFSFTSLNYIYDAFYDKNGYKHIPINISELLSPRVLAIWIMHDGGVSREGVKISTEASFPLEDIKRLQAALFERFGLKYTIQRHKKQYILYLSLKQLPLLSAVVKQHMIPSMHYKLNLKDKTELSP